MMTDSLQVILLVIIFIAGPFWLIYKMDKRAAKKGALFTGPATREMRLLAIVLGVVFAGLFIMEIVSSPTIHLLFPILALALIGYGLGTGQPLRKLQNRREISELSTKPQISSKPAVGSADKHKTRVFSKNKLAQFAIRVVVLAIPVIFILAAVWVSNHPDSSLSLVFIIGIIVLAVLARILNWFKFLRNLFR